jgi:hypothetical protein
MVYAGVTTNTVAPDQAKDEGEGEPVPKPAPPVPQPEHPIPCFGYGPLTIMYTRMIMG